jgi:putative flippase GtrA
LTLPPLLKRFFVFGIIGTVGFITDYAVLMFAVHVLGLGLYSGRLFSYVIAATVTWMGNRTFTFRDRPQKPAAKQWVTFLIFNGIGFAANYGTYATLITFVPFVAAHPVLGVAAGALAAMMFNFTASTRFVFPAH